MYLKSVVLGECHNLHDFADSGKDLEDDVERDRVHHVLHDHPVSAWVNGFVPKIVLKYAKLQQHMQDDRTCRFTSEQCSVPQPYSLLHLPELELPEMKTIFSSTQKDGFFCVDFPT